MWDQITAIKHNILQRMDTAPHPVRVCCIKFVQKVVHTQTPGPIADPRVRTLSLSQYMYKGADLCVAATREK